MRSFLLAMKMVSASACLLCLAAMPVSARHIVPLTPQQAAAWRKACSLEALGKQAQAKKHYAAAAAAYRAETKLPHYRALPWTWVSLGLMLDYLGKRQKAFAAYRQGFGPHMAGSGGPETAVAAARYGLMCADAGLQGDARECYYGARTDEYEEWNMFLPITLDTAKTSPAQVRSFLEIALGIALDELTFSVPGPGLHGSAAAIAAFPVGGETGTRRPVSSVFPRLRLASCRTERRSGGSIATGTGVQSAGRHEGCRGTLSKIHPMTDEEKFNAGILPAKSLLALRLCRVMPCRYQKLQETTYSVGNLRLWLLAKIQQYPEVIPWPTTSRQRAIASSFTRTNAK